MTFIPIPSTYVGASGDVNSPICFIGEAPAREEVRTGKPFSGKAGTIFDFCLQGSGIIRAECYITNVFKKPVTKRKVANKEAIYLEDECVFTHKGFTNEGLKHAEALHEELHNVTSNVLVPMGNPAFCALTGMVGIAKKRGYLTVDDFQRKVLPTLHPMTAIHGEYINRYIIARDFRKAKYESTFPELRYIESEIVIPETFPEAVSLLHDIKQHKQLAVDIETVNHEVAIIGFAPSETYSVAFPMQHMWTLEQETELWRHIASILEDPDISKIFQNGLFDMQFLLFRNHILTRGTVHDTMIAHSVVYPEFPKSLAFLASIYTNRPYWKDMPSFKHHKKES